MGDGGQRVGIQGKAPLPRRRPVQPLQVPPGVQRLVFRPLLTYLPADTRPSPLQLGALRSQLRLPLPQRRIQGQLPPLQAPDGLQRQAQLTQQLDLAQGVRVLLRIIPVAVFLPPGADQPLLLVKADVGPGHVQQRLQLADIHGMRLLIGLRIRDKAGLQSSFFSQTKAQARPLRFQQLQRRVQLGVSLSGRLDLPVQGEPGADERLPAAGKVGPGGEGHGRCRRGSGKVCWE